MNLASLPSLITTTRIDCLRHGEVDGDACFRGRRDDPLSDHGWQQMQACCNNRSWDAVVTSPLMRCHDFAKAWADQHKRSLSVDTDWSEIDFGAWEGLKAKQIERAYPDALQHFYTDPSTFTPPGAESYQHFTIRIQRGWERLMTEFAGQHVLLVTHAGPIRALFSQLLAIPVPQSLHVEVPHACLTRFSCFQEGDNRFVQLNFHNPG